MTMQKQLGQGGLRALLHNACAWRAELLACLQGMAIVLVDFGFDQRVFYAAEGESTHNATADALSYYRTVIRVPQVNLVVLFNLFGVIFPLMRYGSRSRPLKGLLGVDCDLASAVFTATAWLVYIVLVIPRYMTEIACFEPPLVPECGMLLPAPADGVTMDDVRAAVLAIFWARCVGYVFFSLGVACNLDGLRLEYAPRSMEPSARLSKGPQR
eukprot:TRINITY_DN71007_c0_g1_i1.p1 TRINITY_DN71007_c0_g1~~TRINITY_DN71007_c0_g1_i1.p1  ORF type:complete len:237 (+),score=49.88 TRINITY_DN71007_c0_g1_i1:75-713(+)